MSLTYTPSNNDAYTLGDDSSPTAERLDLTRVDGALSDSSGIDSCYGVTSVSKGPETTQARERSQLRSVTVIQVGAASAATSTNYADVENSVNHRLALFATGSAISYAKQKLSLRMTQPAYQYTQSQSANNSNIKFGETDALTFTAVANEFQRQKFQAGAVMSTYRGNAALQMVAAGDPSNDSWGAQVVWEPTPDCAFDSIKGWDDVSEAAFVGEKGWIAAFDYQYYDGSHVTLNLGRYGTTTIGTSDEGQYATEELYFAQKNENVAGSKWGMLQDGKWPRVSTRGNDSGPTVTISGGGGNGATATATCGTEGTVTSITVTNGGSGYFTAPDVAISGGGGSGAEAKATLIGNAVGSITIDNPGSGYTPVPAVRKSDSKSWYAADINSDGSKQSHTVSYGNEKMQIELSGIVVNDAIRQSGISQTTDNNVLDAITPLNCYTNLQLGDSYSFPVGNSFNFRNHAANMGIHVGRSATFNIWSTDPEDWDISDSPNPEDDHWALLEKTHGDSYTYHWGNQRTYAETSDGNNLVRDGQGESIETLASKRTILNAENVTESATVGYNHEYEARWFDFSNSSIGQKYISSAAQFGLNMGISTGLGEQGALSVGLMGFSFKMPPPEATLGQFTMDLSASLLAAKEELSITGLENALTTCLYLVETKLNAGETNNDAGLTDNEVQAVPGSVDNVLAPTIHTEQGVAEADATVATADAALMNVSTNNSLNAKAAKTEVRVLGVNVGTIASA